jgi:hypothetical protein
MTKIKRPTATLGELLVQWLLAGSKIVRKPSYDIFYQGTKVEIKSARATIMSNKTRGWLFDVRKTAQKRWAYRFWLLCFNELYKLERIYVIPHKKIIGNSSIWIGKKWEEYRV